MYGQLSWVFATLLVDKQTTNNKQSGGVEIFPIFVLENSKIIRILEY